MTKNKKTEKQMLTPSQRIVKVSDGVFILKPRDPESKAVLRPYAGTCRVTGERFVLYRSQILRDNVWQDPIVDLHPEKLLTAMEFAAEKKSIIDAYPAEVRKVLGIK